MRRKTSERTCPTKYQTQARDLGGANDQGNRALELVQAKYSIQSWSNRNACYKIPNLDCIKPGIKQTNKPNQHKQPKQRDTTNILNEIELSSAE
jgi:hypothetical protein